ncbi:MAG: hypothetical protein NTY95_07970, partial [Bacteroidia bacterium]|nr:hypothetical protein [Bacteroidia bacterium]
MTDRVSYHINKLLIMLLLMFSFSSVDLKSQETISGIINKYAKVNSISPGYVIVSPAQAAQFSVNDYVLLIQMQGVGIRTDQGSYGINVQSRFGEPGGYEFLIVDSVYTSTG